MPAGRTVILPEAPLAVSLITNAVDGPADRWMKGAINILASFARRGAPSELRDWSGRWWSPWGVVDLVPMGGKE